MRGTTKEKDIFLSSKNVLKKRMTTKFDGEVSAIMVGPLRKERFAASLLYLWLGGVIVCGAMTPVPPTSPPTGASAGSSSRQADYLTSLLWAACSCYLTGGLSIHWGK